MKKLKPEEILALPMDATENDAGAGTIKEYLICLLRTMWAEGEVFSGKRPFGNSSWQYDLYKPLIKSGAVAGSLDEDGYVQALDDKAANKLITKAIDSL